jgi:hypothetical protein
VECFVTIERFIPLVGGFSSGTDWIPGTEGGLIDVMYLWMPFLVDPGWGVEIKRY